MKPTKPSSAEPSATADSDATATAGGSPIVKAPTVRNPYKKTRKRKAAIDPLSHRLAKFVACGIKLPKLSSTLGLSYTATFKLSRGKMLPAEERRAKYNAKLDALARRLGAC